MRLHLRPHTMNKKITLDWILPMLVSLPDLEPFYNTSEFLVDLQSREVFVMLKGKWHPAGLSCRKRNFNVDQLMALIQHTSIKLKKQAVW